MRRVFYIIAAIMLTLPMMAKVQVVDSISLDNPCGLNVIIPDTLYENVTALAVAPEGMDYEWFAQINGGDIHPIDNTGIILNLDEHHSQTSTLVSYDKRLRAVGKKITAYYCSERTTKSLVGWDVVLYLAVRDYAGCDAFFKKKVTIVDEHYGEGLESVQTEEPGIRKVIYNGQVYILQEGHTYLLTGQGIE